MLLSHLQAPQVFLGLCYIKNYLIKKSEYLVVIFQILNFFQILTFSKGLIIAKFGNRHIVLHNSSEKTAELNLCKLSSFLSLYSKNLLYARLLKKKNAYKTEILLHHGY